MSSVTVTSSVVVPGPTTVPCGRSRSMRSDPGSTGAATVIVGPATAGTPESRSAPSTTLSYLPAGGVAPHTQPVQL